MKTPCISGKCGVKEHVVGTTAHNKCMQMAYQAQYPNKRNPISVVPLQKHSSWLSVLNEEQLDELREFVMGERYVDDDDGGYPDWFSLDDEQMLALAYDPRNHRELLERFCPHEVALLIAKTTNDPKVMTDANLFYRLWEDDEESSKATREMYQRAKDNGEVDMNWFINVAHLHLGTDFIDKIARESDPPMAVVQYASYDIARDLVMKNPQKYLETFMGYSRVKEMSLEDARVIYTNPEIGKYGIRHMHTMVQYVAPKEDYALLLRNYFDNEYLRFAIASREQTIESVQAFDELLNSGSDGDGIRATLIDHSNYGEIVREMGEKGIKRPKILGKE